MHEESDIAPPVVVSADRPRIDPANSAGLSLLVPGLAQAMERRWASAITHFGAVMTYLVVVAQAGWGHAGWLAIAWNVWSAVEAYRHARRKRRRSESDGESGL